MAERPEDRIGRNVVITDHGCWAYKGDLSKYHTAATNMGGLQELVHRYFHRVFKGPIPEGHHVHHTCQNPGCVNPDHLMAVSPEWHMRHHRHLEREAG